ncbi:hypothetical protein Hypma_011008 [Hypsizygus marmoreus]|uniref:Uncharacterized protein n=1 Tax=Hypsizygus marmoreus TaxID=39966 RepID=A0A369JQF9_HYPMA|nr:hypothetical protein Hypma_011008 [Hypsizygus marmoreus]
MSFPWDQVKANTLRTICRDLGFSSSAPRETMVTFLNLAADEGLEKAQNWAENWHKQREEPISAASPATPKRKMGAVVSDYETRHKDKRARLSDPGPGVARRPVSRKAAAAKASIAAEAPTPSTANVTPKRARGRPRKNAPKATEEKPVSQSAPREIFDGVVLPAPHHAGKGKGREEDADMGDEAGPPQVNEDGEESSLASSNKENELRPSQPQHLPSNRPANGDAPDGPSTLRVLESSTVEFSASMTDDDMDAEGEVVTESEQVVFARPHTIPIIETHPAEQLSAEDVSQIEQFLNNVVANGRLL